MSYSGCLLHPRPQQLLELDWRTRQRGLASKMAASQYLARDPGLEEATLLQGGARRLARQHYFSGQHEPTPPPSTVRRSSSTCLPRKQSAPCPRPPRRPLSSSGPPSHRHSLDLGALQLLLSLPVAGRRVRPRDCDELPEEFRRAGIGVCFRGNVVGSGWWGGAPEC